MPEKINAAGDDEEFLIYEFYARPCIVLFLRSSKLLHEALKSLASPDYDFEPSKIHAVASTILFILKNEKLRRNLSSSEGPIKNFLHTISILLVRTDCVARVTSPAYKMHVFSISNTICR